MIGKARVDAPGALHHIIVRGVGRARVFMDDTACMDFPVRIVAAGKGTKPRQSGRRLLQRGSSNHRAFTLIICLENLP